MAPKYHHPKGEVFILVPNLQGKSYFSVPTILVLTAVTLELTKESILCI